MLGDQDLISLADSGPIKAMGSTLLMTGLAIVGQNWPLINSPSYLFMVPVFKSYAILYFILQKKFQTLILIILIIAPQQLFKKVHAYPIKNNYWEFLNLPSYPYLFA